MNFKFTGKEVVTCDFWHDLTRGGYIKPSELLTDSDQIQVVEDAVALILNFISQLEEAELIEWL